MCHLEDFTTQIIAYELIQLFDGSIEFNCSFHQSIHLYNDGVTIGHPIQQCSTPSEVLEDSSMEHKATTFDRNWWVWVALAEIQKLCC